MSDHFADVGKMPAPPQSARMCAEAQREFDRLNI